MAVVEWDSMTAEQREFTILMFAGAYMVEFCGFPAVPDDMKARLDELEAMGIWHGTWDEPPPQRTTGSAT